MRVVEEAEMLRVFSQARKKACPGENFCLDLILSLISGVLVIKCDNGRVMFIAISMNFTRLADIVMVLRTCCWKTMR